MKRDIGRPEVPAIRDLPLIGKGSGSAEHVASAPRALGIVRVLAGAAAVALFLAIAAPAAALEQKLTAPDGKAFEFFGSSVAIDGDTAVVGAPAANEHRGAVYVFTRSGDSWTKTGKLTVQPTSFDDAKGVG